MPSSEGVKETRQSEHRGRGAEREDSEESGSGKKGSAEGCCGSEIKSGNYPEQHDSSNTWTVSAIVVLLWPGSNLFPGQLCFIPSR